MEADADLAAKWDAELKNRGRASVIAQLSRGGTGRGAEFELEVAGLLNPNVGYVQDWLGREEAASDAAAQSKE